MSLISHERVKREKLHTRWKSLSDRNIAHKRYGMVIVNSILPIHS